MATGIQFYEKNKEAMLVRIKQWQLDNPDKRKATCKKYYIENRDKIKQAQDRYRKESPEKYLLGLAKRRAKKNGLEFNIDILDIPIPEVCPLLNIPLNSYSIHNDFRPSIDRINSKKGYIKGNVMIVSQKANRLKNNSTGNELLNLAINLLRIEGEIK